MDTRFWGPDGWLLLHSIAQNYPNNPTKDDKETYSYFFNSLKYVLPCIYCRRSLEEYTIKLPINSFLSSKQKLTFWLYQIHNMVNKKLRDQGLNNKVDPNFKEIYLRYQNFVIEINDNRCVNMPGWDFIYSLVFNYPNSYKELSMDRYVNYAIFLKLLFKVLPFNKIKQYCLSIVDSTNYNKILVSRYKLKLWFYKIEQFVKKKINCKCICYKDRCKYIEYYRAGCTGKNDEKPTCRKKNK